MTWRKYLVKGGIKERLESENVASIAREKKFLSSSGTTGPQLIAQQEPPSRTWDNSLSAGCQKKSLYPVCNPGTHGGMRTARSSRSITPDQCSGSGISSQVLL